MNVNKLNNEINKISETLISARMAIDYNFSLLDSKQSTIAVKTKKKLFEIVTINNIIDRYKNFISNKFYNCLLFDGSLLQFYYRYSNGKIINHRLCYIPCPINIYSCELEEFSIIGIIEKVQKIPQELSNRSKEHTILRFDYDIENQSVIHPASHLTFLSSNCRIPVCSPLSPLMFIQFILNNFYEENFLVENNVNIRMIDNLKIKKSTSFEIDKCLLEEHEKIFHINIV